ncbi:MAG: hypothetical protein ACLFVQ_00755 [Chitinispirillaceae bacterium]
MSEGVSAGCLEAVSALQKSLKIQEGFEKGAEKLASFFKRSEERWDPGDIVKTALSQRSDPKTLEFMIFSFLHIGRSDLDTAQDVLRFRRLTILLLRAIHYPTKLSAKERRIVSSLQKELSLRNMAQFRELCRGAAVRINALFAKQQLDESSRHQLGLLLESEAEALAERLSYVTERIDPYDLRSMAKMLPLVTIYEERAKTYRSLASSIRSGEEIGGNILLFEYLMKEDGFEKWLKRIAKKNCLQKFLQSIVTQREKQVPTLSLVGVSSLSRCILGDLQESTPLDWAAHSLENCNGSRFSFDCETQISKIEKLVKGSTVHLHGAIVEGDCINDTLSNLVGTDLLTVPPRRREVEIYDLVSRSIANDSVLLRLLDNPKVYSRPGLVEYVAKASRSIAVLTKIASQRTLYTGTANLGVPAALLKNPSMIPLSLLRGFISTRYLSIADLREIARSPHTVRRDVYREVESFMNRRF